MLSGKPTNAAEIVFERVQEVLAQKLVEARKMVNVEDFGLLKEGITEYPKATEHVADVHSFGDHVGHITHETDPHPHFRLHSHSHHTEWKHSVHDTYAEAKKAAHHLIAAHARGEAAAEEDHAFEQGQKVSVEEASSDKKKIDEDAPHLTLKRAGPTSALTTAPTHAQAPKGYEVRRPAAGSYSVHHTATKISVGKTSTLPHGHPERSNGHEVVAHHHHNVGDDESSVSFHTTHQRAIDHIAAGHKTHGITEGKKSTGYHVWKAAMEKPYVVKGTINNTSNETHSSHASLDDAKTAANGVKDAKIFHAVSGKEITEATLNEKSEYRYEKIPGGYVVHHHQDGPVGETEHVKHETDSGPALVRSHHYNSGQDVHNSHKEAAQHIISLHKNSISESITEAHKPNKNVQKQGRVKVVKVRVRGGKVQRRKKLSNAKGYIERGGKLVRMSATEKRHRKMGARKGKMKRRAHRGQALRHLRQSLRKRKSMGIH